MLARDHWTVIERDLVERASVFALAAHTAVGQTRDYSGEPYIIHPAEVASIVAGAGGSAEAVAVAWLHDVVEDTGIGIETIAKEFGGMVAAGVFHLSHASTRADGKRSIRRSIDLMHLGTLTPEEADVKVADFISDTKTIVGRAKAGFALMYLREKAVALDLLELLGAKPALVKLAREQITDGLAKLAGKAS